MLTVAEIDLPPSVRERLRERAAFSDSFGRFARLQFLGFHQPVAAAVALLTPIVVAMSYAATDVHTTLQVVSIFLFSTCLIMAAAWIANRTFLRNAYEQANMARRTARADLRAGRGEEMALTMRTPALFYENADGVVVFADAGEGKTVFFAIRADRNDARWFLYLNGDLHREQWSWIKLATSGEIIAFSAAGHRRTPMCQPPYVEAAEAWDSIALALGDPADGDIIDMPLDEVERTISRLL